MPPQMKNIYSSHVNKIGYDKATQTLHVIWDTGKESTYAGVPEATANTVMNSGSVGSMLHSEIKNKFTHAYKS